MNNVPGLNTSRQYAIYGIVLSQEDLMQCSYKKMYTNNLFRSYGSQSTWHTLSWKSRALRPCITP